MRTSSRSFTFSLAAILTFIYLTSLSGTTLFAGTTGAVLRSTNNGDSWGATGALQTGSDVVAMAVSGSAIFAGAEARGERRTP